MVSDDIDLGNPPPELTFLENSKFDFFLAFYEFSISFFLVGALLPLSRIRPIRYII